MISIIIPVYNTEKYLGRCINSVLASTYKNFEILLIDDGSKDRSLAICREYSDKDRRVRVFAQENQGVSAARNKGIEESRGEWIVFVDSDDFISSDFLAVIAENIDQGVDIILFDYCKYKRRLNANIEDRFCNYISSINYCTEYRFSIIQKMLCAKELTDNTNTSLLSPWAKVYKKSLILENGIRFPTDIKIGEDRLFNLEYYFKIRNYMHISRTVYYVTWRADSLSHCYQVDLIDNYHIFHRKLRKIMIEQGIFETLQDAYYDTVLANMTEILIYGIFHPYSTRTRSERRRICRSVHEDEIVRQALENSKKKGNLPRRILLFFFGREHYGTVNLICKLSYFVLRRLKR